MLAKTIGLKKRRYELLDKIIDDHAAKLSSSSSQKQHDRHDDEQEDQERDFVDVLLSLQHEYNLTRDNIKAILIDMFAAGTHPSYVVMEFAMAELMRKPRLMAKLQAEVRSKTPKGQQAVKEDDLRSTAQVLAQGAPPLAPLQGRDFVDVLLVRYSCCNNIVISDMA